MLKLWLLCRLDSIAARVLNIHLRSFDGNAVTGYGSTNRLGSPCTPGRDTHQSDLQNVDFLFPHRKDTYLVCCSGEHTKERKRRHTSRKVKTKKKSERSDFCANRENGVFLPFFFSLGFSNPPLTVSLQKMCVFQHFFFWCSPGFINSMNLNKLLV